MAEFTIDDLSETIKRGRNVRVPPEVKETMILKILFTDGEIKTFEIFASESKKQVVAELIRLYRWTNVQDWW